MAAFERADASRSSAVSTDFLQGQVSVAVKTGKGRDIPIESGPFFVAGAGLEPSTYSSSSWFYSLSGGDLLSYVLRRSAVGVSTPIGPVWDGVGSVMPAMIPRPKKRLKKRVASPQRT